MFFLSTMVSFSSLYIEALAAENIDGQSRHTNEDPELATYDLQLLHFLILAHSTSSPQVSHHVCPKDVVFLIVDDRAPVHKLCIVLEYPQLCYEEREVHQL